MTSLINFNQSHIVNDGYNNKLRYQLTTSGANFAGMELAVESISMYNSQFNIRAEYDNNKFSILVPVDATYQVLNITLPDGIYNYSDINSYVQLQLFNLGAYYIDPDRNFVYSIQISGNTTYYTCQIDLSPTLVTFPVDWDTPSGLYFSNTPTTGWTPKIVIPNTNISKTLGILPGTYPATNQTTTQTFMSTFCPQINPVSSYVLRCNLINNQYTIPSDIITSFTKGDTEPGDTISIRSLNPTWIPVMDAQRSYIELVIVDQEQRPIYFKDPQININLVIRPIKK